MDNFREPGDAVGSPVMITQLKEMVLAEESARHQKLADTRLKVEKYTSQLAKIRDRTKSNRGKTANPISPRLDVNEHVTLENVPKLNQKEDNIVPNIEVISQVKHDIPTSSIADTKTNKPKMPSREVTKLLHQQIKEHKATIAERAKNEMELEKAIMKIQKQLEENQSVTIEPSQPILSKAKADIVFSKDNLESPIITELKYKITKLENNILDLQETCKEKDSVIKAKTDAITLMSADLSKKGKNTLDLLDDTKEQMKKMQENFAVMEDNMKAEKQSLIAELEACKNKITHLEEANSILESERFKLSIESNNMEEKIQQCELEIKKLNLELKENLMKFEEVTLQNSEPIVMDVEEKGMSEISKMEKLTNKIEELEKVNTLLRQSNEDLEKQISLHNQSRNILDTVSQVDDEIKDTPDILNVYDCMIDSLCKQILNIELSIKTGENILETFDTNSGVDNSSNLDLETLVKKVKNLEEMNTNLLKMSSGYCEQLPGETQKQSKSPEKEKPNQSKLPSKSFKPPQKSKKSQKNKTKPDVSKDVEEQNVENIDFIQSSKKQCNVILSLHKKLIDKINYLLQKVNLNDNSIPNIIKVDQDTITENVHETFSGMVITGVCHETSTDVSTDNDVASLKEQLECALKQIDTLSKDISDSNKNMIKLKASHKSKIKQMQKCIDDYSKVSDSNSEVIRLQGEVNNLTQKITELEDDKGNLQLHLVDYDSGRVSDSQLHAKLADLERISEDRLKAIADLEKQKFDLVQDLHFSKQTVSTLEDRVADLTYLENEHVSSEIKCVQLEEQLDLLRSEIKTKVQDVNSLLSDKSELSSLVDKLNKEKIDISNKLEFYIQENIDLIDRLDKLSAEKVSSAESIEMVEALTSQEKIEIEQYHKEYEEASNISKIPNKDEENTSDKDDLLRKVELFTIERQEVMEKIEHLQSSNNALTAKIEELLEEKNRLEEQLCIIKNEKNILQGETDINIEKLANDNLKINELTIENERLNTKVNELLKLQSSADVSSKSTQIEDNVQRESLLTTSIATDGSMPLEASSSNSKPDKKVTKEILRLKNVLKSKESEISNLNLKIDDLSEANEYRDKLLSDINIINEKYQDSLKINGTLNEQLQHLQSSLSNNEKQLEFITSDLQQERNKTLQLENMIQSQNAELANSSNLILTTFSCNLNLLNMTLSENETGLSDSLIDLNQYSSYSEKINFLSSELQEKIKILSMVLKNNRQEIRDVSSELENNLKIINQLKDECVKSVEKITKQADEINALNIKISENVTESQTKTDDSPEKRITNEDILLLESTNVELAKKICELEVELKRNIDLLSQAEFGLIEVTNLYKLSESNVNEKDLQIQTLQDDITVLKSKCEIIECNLAQSNSKLQDLDNLNAKLQENVQSVSDEKENLASRTILLTNENENLILQNKSLQSKLSDYDTQLKQLSQENIHSLEKLEEKINECENIKAGLAKINSLEELLNNKQNEIKNLMQQLEEIHNTFKESKSAHEAKLQERDAYIENLESELNKIKERNSRLENKIALMETLEKKAKKLVMKIQEKDSIISKKSEQESIYEKKIQEFSADKDILANQLTQFQNENSELHNTISNLQEEKNNVYNELKKCSAEIVILQNDLASLQLINEQNTKLLEEHSILEQKLNHITDDFNENMKIQLKEKQDLENMLQSQTDNYEIEYDNFNTQFKRMQDELNMQLQKCADLEKKCKSLKTEYENILIEKHSLEEAYYLLLSKLNNSDVQDRLDFLSTMLSKKKNELNNLQIHSLANISDTMSNFDTEENIRKLDNQLSLCLSELQHLLDLHKQIEITNNENMKIINEKNLTITDLESELQQLKSPPMESSHMIHEDIKKINVSNIFAKVHGDVPDSQARTVDLQSLEDQILTSDEIDNQAKNISDNFMIRAFQHDSPTSVPAVTTQTEKLNTSAIDESITPKTTYLCFNPDNSEHSTMITELQNTIESLSKEKEKLSTDLVQSQTKTNKALIKLKEYKLKHDNLANELKKLKTNSGFDFLDNAIQDELSSQVKNLEEKLEEIKSASIKDKLEKENLLKRVDFLTSANDKLISLKEKQDIELESCLKSKEALTLQLKNSQKSDKDEKSNWDSSFEVHEVQNPSSKYDADKFESLDKKINSLQADNEELELQLDQKIKELEVLNKALKDLSEKECEMNRIKQENDALKNIVMDNENIKNEDTVKDLTKKVENLQTENEKFRVESENKSKNLDIQMAEIKVLKDQGESLNTHLGTIKSENLDLKKQIDGHLLEIDNLNDVVNKNLSDYQLELQKQKEALESSNTEFDKLKSENAALIIEIEKLSIQINSLHDMCKSLEAEKECSQNNYEQLLSSMKDIQDEKEKLLAVENGCQLELNSIMNEKTILTQKLDELYKTLDSLSHEKNTLITDLGEKSRELQISTESLKNLEEEMENIKSNFKHQENNYEEVEQQLQRKIEVLESKYNDLDMKYLNEVEKNSSNDNELRNKLEVTEKQLQALKLEFNESKNSFNHQITAEENKSEELANMHEKLTSNLLEAEQKVKDTFDLYNSIIIEKTDLEKILQSKNEDLAKYYEYEAMCNNKFNEINAIFNAKDAELQEKSNQIQFLINDNESKHFELENKMKEMQSLIIKTQDYDDLALKLSETQAKLLELSNQQDSNITNINMKFDSDKSELEKKLSDLEAHLKEKNDECHVLEQKIQETQALIDEETIQMTDMRSALESQEIEIVTLKEHLIAQTAAYEKINRLYTKSERHVSFSEDTKPGDDSLEESSSGSNEKNTAAEKPSRADLDLALYMLHQRDVRCEELTAELMQLLEERDTLQLKLSNSIRTNEEMRSKINNPQLVVPEPIASPSNVENVEDGSDLSANTSLEDKLSELHGVNQQRDIRVRDDRELRQRQMELLQRDVQNLPPEAVAQLREAHYTLSRDTQSTSTVLFNWLWGKTTPKVVDM